jgi:hypothetical protein
MQPIKPLFYVYGSSLRPKPLEPGTALYCRIYLSESQVLDFRWDVEGHEWRENDYIGRLLSRGEPDLEQIDQSEIPIDVGWPKFW